MPTSTDAGEFTMEIDPDVLLTMNAVDWEADGRYRTLQAREARAEWLSRYASAL